MANYLHVASGTLGGTFAWSFTAKSSSSSNEAAAQSAWDDGISSMFNLTALNDLFASDVELTETSTSTATADWKQSTITKNTHAIAGAATQSLPYQVAEVVTLDTDLATKYGRGRWYLPPLAVGALATDGFVLSAAAVTAVVDGVNAAFAAWAGVLTLQILHRNGSLGGAVAPLSTTPVSSGSVSNKFVIQKRRADKLVPTRSAITV
jgi:hypothetical protein